MFNKVVRKNLVIAAGFFWTGTAGYGQGVATERPGSAIVEIQTAQTATVSNSGQDLTMAGEDKTSKNVVEQEKPVFWNWYSEFGYESEYIFRGTNVTPGSDGDLFLDLEVSKWGFTLGFTDIYQLGTARASSFSLGEGGGGGTGAEENSPSIKAFAPETVQKFFNELDVFFQYQRSFGPVELTAGNIGFFIHREAQTFLDVTFFDQRFSGLYGPYPTVQNEQFDRVFVRLATSVIPHIQPWITYYQTVINDGQDNRFYVAPHIPPLPNGEFVFFGSPPPEFLKKFFHEPFPPPQNNNYHERNDELGGYLEGRIRGNFPIGEWIDINPFWIISYSYHDRSEPVNVLADSDPNHDFKDILRGRSLVGWNHTQVGLELPIHILHFAGSSSTEWAPPDVRVNLVPFGDYSYHISKPTAGTDRNEWWGGVKVAVTF
jgi:hypothetical protein